jgi:hypothetical protein
MAISMTRAYHKAEGETRPAFHEYHPTPFPEAGDRILSLSPTILGSQVLYLEADPRYARGFGEARREHSERRAEFSLVFQLRIYPEMIFG